VCGWPENLSLRLDLWKVCDQLGQLVQAPAIKAAFQTWAEGSVAAVAGIQQKLIFSAPAVAPSEAEAVSATPPASPVAVVQAEAAVPAAAAMAAAAAAPAPACEAAQRVKPAKAKRQALSGWARAAGGALLAAAAFAAHHSQPLPCGAADNDAAPSLPPELLPLLPCLNAAGLPPSPRWVRRGC
jgi:type IV secretory pathway VirB10-like protein